MGVEHPAGNAAMRHLANLRVLLARLAEDARLRDPDSFAQTFQIPHGGPHRLGGRGRPRRRTRAKDMARTWIDQHRQEEPDLGHARRGMP
jgi:hypothetical protein